MTEAFRAHLQQSGLIPPGARVLVGVSGGVDSLCLLHLLHDEGIEVVAAHLNHGQRAEAEDEAEFVRGIAEALGVPFVAGKADVPQMMRDLGMGAEEAGRHARYGFFRSAARQTECHLIATAHHLDDHVETVLFHAVRGSGLAGLAGIPERRENIVRPLLPFSRADLENLAKQRGWTPVNDPSNEDVSFSRARLRHRVMPELEAINSDYRQAIWRLSQIADAENSFLDGMAAAALENAEVRLNGDMWWLSKDCEVCLARAEVMTLPHILQVRAMRLVAGVLGGALDADQSSTLLQGLQRESQGSITSEGGRVHVSWDERHIEFRQAQPIEPFRYPLTVPGETDSLEFGWTFTADIVHGSSWEGAGRFEARLDADRLAGSLHLRGAAAGDQMTPLGFEGRKMLSDILREMGLTQAARVRLPIICDMTGPIWIPGGPIADRAKVTTETLRQMRIRFGPLEPDADRANGP